MREIRPSGSEGGVALTTPLLPLSAEDRALRGRNPSASEAWQTAGRVAPAARHAPAGASFNAKNPTSSSLTAAAIPKTSLITEFRF